MNSEKYQIDMCHGPIFGKIVRFAMPLILTSILQLLFNAADMIVIGRFSTAESMAAIGSTLNTHSVIICFFFGLSVGSNVIAARFFGAKDLKRMEQALHTTMALSCICGVGLTILGIAVAKQLLLWQSIPEEIFDKAYEYTWICFCGIPFLMIYNFGCSILRAVGDTRHPLYFLMIAGTINIILNLIFVITFKMDVVGVALATIISQFISALLVVMIMFKSEGCMHLDCRKLKMEPEIIREIMRIGVPAGIQGSMFTISNFFIQSSINSFGSKAIAGSTACLCLEGIVYVGSYAFHQTAVSFSAQNLGGSKYKRIRTSMLECYICAIVTCILLGFAFLIFGKESLSVFNEDPQVIEWGMIRMKLLFTTYALCGIMDVSSGALRGIGYSMLSMTFCLLGACVFRLWWVFQIFPIYMTFENLMLSYPVSWLLVAVMNTTAFFILFNRLMKAKVCRKTVFYDQKPGFLQGFRKIVGQK